MNWAEVFLIVVLLIGFFGTIIPMVPGLGMMFAAILIYGFYDGWVLYSPILAVIAGVFTILGAGIDYAGSAIGAKKFGASKHGVIASLLGGVIGLLLFSFVGMLIGSVLALVCVEYYEKRDLLKSTKTAVGVLVGNIVGIALQAVMAMGLFGYVFIKLV